MDIQKELREWADRTAKGYVAIANDLKDKAPSFYTQSDLTKITGTPEVIVLGINPGSKGYYLCQKTNPNWGLNGKDMDGEHLILGNYCKNDKGKPNWEDRNKWPFWQRLKAYFGDVLPANPLDNEQISVVTNITFFNSSEAKDINNDLFLKTMHYSIELIEILNPKHVIFLGGRNTLKKLIKANKNNKDFCLIYDMINNRVCKGQLNGKSFLAVPHPSAHLKREEREAVVDCITAFMK